MVNVSSHLKVIVFFDPMEIAAYVPGETAAYDPPAKENVALVVFLILKQE